MSLCQQRLPKDFGTASPSGHLVGTALLQDNSSGEDWQFLRESLLADATPSDGVMGSTDTLLSDCGDIAVQEVSTEFYAEQAEHVTATG